MAPIRTIAFGLLALGAVLLPGAAFAAPSATCTEADTGGLDIAGTLSATITITRTPAAGETFFATLQGGVTNSLLIVNGKTLFSGQTTGTRSFKGTGAPITIIYDIQGSGAMRFSCEEAPPDPPDPPTPPSSASKTTETITSANSPLSGVGGGPGVPTGIIPADLFPGGPSTTQCPPAATTAERLKKLRGELESLGLKGGFALANINDLEEQIEATEAEVVANGLAFNPAGTYAAQGRLGLARWELRAERAKFEDVKQQRDAVNAEIAELTKCEGGAPSVSQFAATPDYGPNSPLAAFGLFEGTQTLIDEDGIKAWVRGGGSLLGGGPSDLSGAKGAVSVGAAKRLDGGTALAGEIGIAGGRTEIGADDTTADFAALSAMIAASHEVAESVQLSFGATGGYAWNSVDMAGATGNFGSAAISGFATLSATHEIDGVVIAPSATLSASTTRSAAYTLSDNTAVAATSVSQLDVSGLLHISKRVALIDEAMTIDPFVAFGAGYGLASGGSLGGLSGSLSLGVNGTRLDGIGFGLSGVLGGTASGIWSAGISGSISGSF